MTAVSTSSLRRALLPVAVFALAFAAHFAWRTHAAASAAATPCADGECTDCAEEVAPAAEPPSALTRYASSGEIWLGWSTALPLSYAAVVLRRRREQARASGRGLVLASIGLSGLLGFAGCWLVGCCGSPMLGVWMSLLGAAFLPFAAPVVAAISTAFVATAWWRSRRAKTDCGPCDGGSCAPCAVPPPR